MSQEAATTVRQILIVDDEPAVVQALAVRCDSIGLGVHRAYDAIEALKILDERPIDLALIDLNMPGPDGLTLCDMMRTNPAIGPVPVVILTGHNDDATRKRCEALGAIHVLKTPDAWQTLERIIRRLTTGVPQLDDGSKDSMVDEEPPGVLIIDDDPDIARCLRPRFRSAGFEVATADTANEGYWRRLKDRPAAILLDYRMPDGYGNSVLARLTTDATTRSIPVIMLSGVDDLGIQRDLMRLGARRWITKPFDAKAVVDIVRTEINAV